MLHMHKYCSAQIAGVVFSGFGLSALPFSAIQSLLINPANVAPQAAEVTLHTIHVVSRSTSPRTAERT